MLIELRGGDDDGVGCAKGNLPWVGPSRITLILSPQNPARVADRLAARDYGTTSGTGLDGGLDPSTFIATSCSR